MNTETKKHRLENQRRRVTELARLMELERKKVISEAEKSLMVDILKCLKSDYCLICSNDQYENCPLTCENKTVKSISID